MHYQRMQSLRNSQPQNNQSDQQNSPDIKQCQICNTKFTLMTREHKCKRCFKSICEKCGSIKRLIIGYSVKPKQKHKMCNICGNESILQEELRKSNKLKWNTDSRIGDLWLKRLYPDQNIKKQELLDEMTKLQQLSEETQQSSSFKLFQKFFENEFYKIKEDSIGKNQSFQEMLYYVTDKIDTKKKNNNNNFQLFKNYDFVEIKMILRAFINKYNSVGFSGEFIDICLFLLCFCSAPIAYGILIKIFEKIIPEQVHPNKLHEKGYNHTNSIICQYLIKIYKNNFGLEIGASSALSEYFTQYAIQNILTLLITKVNFMASFEMFNEIIKDKNPLKLLIQYFIALTETNIQTIKSIPLQSEMLQIQIIDDTEISSLKIKVENMQNVPDFPECQDIHIIQKKYSLLQQENNELKSHNQSLVHELENIQLSQTNFLTNTSFFVEDILGQSRHNFGEDILNDQSLQQSLIVESLENTNNNQENTPNNKQQQQRQEQSINQNGNINFQLENYKKEVLQLKNINENLNQVLLKQQAKQQQTSAQIQNQLQELQSTVSNDQDLQTRIDELVQQNQDLQDENLKFREFINGQLNLDQINTNRSVVDNQNQLLLQDSINQNYKESSNNLLQSINSSDSLFVSKLEYRNMNKSTIVDKLKMDQIDYKSQLLQKQSEIIKLQQFNADYENELAHYDIQTKQLQEKNESLEEELQNLQKQLANQNLENNSNLSDNEDKNEKIQKLENKILKLKNKLQDSEELQKNYEQLQFENQQLQNKIKNNPDKILNNNIIKVLDNTDFQNSTNINSNNNINQNDENQNLNNINLNEQNYQKKIQQLEQQIQDLNNLNKNIEKDNEENQNLQQFVKDLQKQIIDQEKIYDIQKQQIRSLEDRETELEDEIEEIKNLYNINNKNSNNQEFIQNNDIQNQNQIINNVKNNILQDIEQPLSVQELNQLQEKNLQLEANIEELKDQIDQLNKQIIQQERTIQEKVINTHYNQEKTFIDLQESKSELEICEQEKQSLVQCLEKQENINKNLVGRIFYLIFQHSKQLNKNNKEINKKNNNNINEHLDKIQQKEQQNQINNINQDNVESTKINKSDQQSNEKSDTNEEENQILDEE